MTEDVSPTTLSGFRWTSNPSSGLLFENSTVFNGTEEELDGCDPRNVINFNCSLENYLTFTMGPKRLPLEEAIPFTVAYLVIFVTGVVGNAAVCVVIVRHPSMRTATNYYLFSLACSDLMLLLFGLPNDLSCYWHQYPYVMGTAFCKFRALISEASSYVSVLTIVAFSMERYLAICHPLHLYAMSGLQRAVRIIAALWFVSMAAAMPFAVFTTVHYLDYPPQSNRTSAESAFCAMLGQPAEMPLWELSSIIFFILPALIMIFLYSRMGLRIRSRHGRRRNTLKGVNGSVHGEARQAQSRKAIIRMLAAVVIAFFLCWAPFHAQRLLYLYGRQLAHYKDINQWLFSVAGLLYYVSATVNPILYNVMSNRYRVAFQETLCCGRRRGANTFTRDHSFHETVVSETGLIRARTARRRTLHHYGPEKPQTTLVLNKNYANNKLMCKGNGCTKSKVIFSMKHNSKKEHRSDAETNGNTNRLLTYETDLDKNYIDLESDIIKNSSDKSNISIEIYVPMKGDSGEKQLLADDGNEQDAHQDLVIVLGNSAGKNVKKVYAGMCCKPLTEDTVTSLKTSNTFIETCI